MVHELLDINHPNQICKGCEFGKQPKKSFANEASFRAKKPLKLIHTDVCRPITPASFGKHRYFLTFIYDYSRKTLVYFLKEKLEAFIMFKKFKASTEKENGFLIKSIRSNRGGEFTSKVFKKYYEKHGIRHQLTAPFSP
ncbi:Retrovirus-related Pol polyprotein from transposon TNT 1-94 [Dendrobium catenatum]|uniref:Retrovirus-related Pol polyprotein from transposon TNT 1-94 n=1 Tax=Dendrobium catenatum TaxID=906689 RepID=A0A2I0X2I9_9ASPA|nr:Retrovirus-related Pol polyprotein from transposon TNT 1-94 [Dendrobium catenatum]